MISEDAIEQVLAHILPRVHDSKSSESHSPFILGLSGLQGSGKSSWAAALVDTLTLKHGLRAQAISLDEFYWPHEQLVALRTKNPENALWRQRGQPGTHDEDLAQTFFKSLQPGVDSQNITDQVIRIPAFDKSKFSGEGDRVPKNEWKTIPASPPLDIIIFEGWCVGFQPISDQDVKAQWTKAKQLDQGTSDSSLSNKTAERKTVGTLADHKLEHLLAVNAGLARYCDTFMGTSNFDAMVHLSTSTLANVYRWRLDQEHAMRKRVGSSMSDDEVIAFVRGYMPAYEMYLDRFSTEPFFGPGSGKIQLRVDLDVDRSVKKIDIVS